MLRLVKFYILLLIIGIGSFGFIFINFLSIHNSLLFTHCATTLLLVTYLLMTILKVKKTGENKKIFLILFITTILLNILFFLVFQQLKYYFSQNPNILRWIVTSFFLVSITITIFVRMRIKK